MLIILQGISFYPWIYCTVWKKQAHCTRSDSAKKQLDITSTIKFGQFEMYLQNPNETNPARTVADSFSSGAGRSVALCHQKLSLLL